MKVVLSKNERVKLSVGSEVIPKGAATERNNYWKLSHLNADGKVRVTRIEDKDFDTIIDLFDIQDKKFEQDNKQTDSVYTGKNLMTLLKKMKLHIEFVNGKRGFVYQVKSADDDLKFVTSKFTEIWDALTYDSKVFDLDEPFAYTQNF